MAPHWRRAWLWIPPVLYAGAIFYVSSLSDPMPSVTSVVWDKALHAAEYAGLAVFLCRALRGESLSVWTSVALAIVIASTYGVSDEWHQAVVSGRQADLTDWIADTLGAALGTACYVAIRGTR